MTGDYQPAEGRFGLSRQMLGICLNLCFPVFVLERSPLVLRDLDLLQEINSRAPSVVAFSIISTPEPPHYDDVRKIERNVPPPEERFKAMEKLANSGLLSGTCLMPLLPGLCDNETNLEAVVRWTARHGGRFVLAGTLTLADQQKDHFLHRISESFPDLIELYGRLYPSSSYAPRHYSWQRIPRRIRALCKKHGISDRIPRPVNSNDRLAFNKRIVEKLVVRIHDMELAQEPEYSIWAYRRAAWAIEELQEDIRTIYHKMGLDGLKSISDVGSLMGERVESFVHELTGEYPV